LTNVTDFVSVTKSHNALTKDMLSHAFRDNYEVAVLVAGDGDYVLFLSFKRYKDSERLYLCGFLRTRG